MGNFSDNELERPCKYQSPGHRLYPHPHRTRKYWIVTFIIHITFLIFSTLMLHHFNQARISQSLLFQPEFNDNDKALFGTPLSPLNNKQPYHIESVSTDYWNSRLFFGKPSPESDIAWLSLLSPRSLRMTNDEAVHLNITDSMRIQPGEDFAVELGIIHNLHCLRSIRQAMDADYYYPGASDEELAIHQQHTRHCLEVLRLALLCNPDLNPYPYTRGRENQPAVSVSAAITRKCVNWGALQTILAAYEVEGKSLMLNTGPFS